MNIESFIKRHGIGFTYKSAPENPHWSGKDMDGTAHYFYTFDIGGGKRKLQGYYSKGPGLRVWKQSSWNGYKRPTGWAKGERTPMPFGRQSQYDREAYLAWSEPEPPNAAEVLDCLASDASGIVCCSSFEEWASEYGMDPDSRSAETTYRATLANTDKLRKFLGSEDFRVLLEDIERL